MKKVAAWAFLVIYLNAAAQSLLPWVSDGLAHVFFWQGHLEHVHNGQIHSHHVGLEMAAQAADEHSHSPVGHLPFSGKDVLSAHCVPELTVALPVIMIGALPLNAFWSFHYRNISRDVFLPPPDRAV